jgi:hypothetical protein
VTHENSTIAGSALRERIVEVTRTSSYVSAYPALRLIAASL